MPLYEYQCPDCGHRFEEIQKVSDDPIRVCPECGEQRVSKLIGLSRFALKGSGWYSDHYGLKSGGGGSTGSSGSAESGSGASKSKTDSTTSSSSSSE